MINYVLSIISGIAVCIPIIITLVKTIMSLAKEKNWSAIVAFVLDYMAQAENLFERGADRKTWVMEMLEQTVIQLNYPYDDNAREKVSCMIDDICDASRVINSEVYLGD